jgi:penicillin-binding protein 1A
MPDTPPSRDAAQAHARRRHVAMAALLALPLAIALYVVALIATTPSIGDLKHASSAKPSVLMSADGQTLTSFRRSPQQPLALDQVSPQVIQALLATEDRRFYEHHGLDWRRTLSAAWHTLNGDTQGGSTITQQLARNLFPDDVGHARNLHRKLKEIVTALRIERVYSKPQILEVYLNTAPFLYNAVGIEMAARTYFGKSAHDLDAAEAATLVGMLKGTYYYNPVVFPERALKRRNLVLQQMVRAGSLSEPAYERESTRPLHVKLTRQDEDLGPAPHFAAYARRWLLDWAQQHDVDLYSDGLVIRTTIDSRLQRLATRAVARQAQVLQEVADNEWRRAALPAPVLRETAAYKQARDGGAGDAEALRRVQAAKDAIAKLRADKIRLEAGFLAMDPNSGEIKAWVGSRDFEQDQFDHVAQAERQPGSTFKPIVYGAALEAGIGPDRTYLDGPVEVRLDARTVWRPTDIHGFSGQMLTLRDGLVYSKNTITAQVSQDVGVPRIVALAQAMGVDQSKLDPVPSLALGTSPVTLLEMVDAYSTIAAQGTHHKPVFIRRITDASGQVLAEFGPEASRALNPDNAVDLIDMMRGVVNQGTGTAIKTRFDIRADVAGKTGTTQYNTDGWFILMHPQLVAGAWVGFDDQRITMRSDYWGQGGHNAVLLVGDFFREALKGKLIDPKSLFPPPRRPVVVATDVVPPAEPPDDSYGRIEDIVPSSPATADSGEVGAERAASGTVMIGDPAGLRAMRRSTGPPKSAEELERALGRAAAASSPTELPPVPANVTTSGTGSEEASAPAPPDSGASSAQ